MGVGRGVKASLDFEIFSQKSIFFLVLSWQKQISPLLALPWRNRLVAPPLGKNPSDAYDQVIKTKPL